MIRQSVPMMLAALAYGGCSSALPEVPEVAQICGDGTVNANEACDDGNTLSNDACTELCIVARCGDGFRRRVGPARGSADRQPVDRGGGELPAWWPQVAWCVQSDAAGLRAHDGRKKGRIDGREEC